MILGVSDARSEVGRQKQGRVPRRIGETIPVRRAVAYRLGASLGHVSRPLRVRLLPYWLTGLLPSLRRPSLFTRGCPWPHAPSHLHRPAAFHARFFFCIQPCFHLQTLTWRCRHVRPRKTQDQNENRPRQEDARPHREPLTIAARETRQRHSQLQRIRPASEPIPVHAALANSLAGTRAQVGFRVACRDQQA